MDVLAHSMGLKSSGELMPLAAAYIPLCFAAYASTTLLVLSSDRELESWYIIISYVCLAIVLVMLVALIYARSSHRTQQMASLGSLAVGLLASALIAYGMRHEMIWRLIGLLTTLFFLFLAIPAVPLVM